MKTKQRADDDIKMDLTEMGNENVERMHVIQNSAQWRVHLNTTMKLRILRKGKEFTNQLSDYLVYK